MGLDNFKEIGGYILWEDLLGRDFLMRDEEFFLGQGMVELGFEKSFIMGLVRRVNLAED